MSYVFIIKELIERVQQLEAHVIQLRNLLKPKSVSDKHEIKQKAFDHKKYAVLKYF